MTKPKTKKEDKPVFDQFKEEHIEMAAKALKGEAVRVELEIPWLPSSAKLADHLKKGMAEEIGADKDALSIAKRIFDSKHPLIKAANKAKNELDREFKLRSLPWTSIPWKAVVKKAETDEDFQEQVANLARTKPGTRIVWKSELEELSQIIASLTPNIDKAVKELEKNYDEFKAHEQKRLGDGYDPDNYPSNLSKIGCVDIDILPVVVDLDLQELAPTAFEMLVEGKNKEIEHNVTFMVGNMVRTLMSTVRTAIGSLGDQLELLPAAKGKWGFLRGGVLKEKRTHEDDPEIPEGQFAIRVYYTPASEKDKKKGKKNVDEWFGPFTKDELDKLNITPSGKRNTVTDSVFKSLVNQAEQLQIHGEQFGSVGEPLTKLGEEIEQVFSNAGGNFDQMMREIKNSGFFRRSAKDELEKLESRMEQLIEATPVKAPKKRRIKKLKKKA